MTSLFRGLTKSTSIKEMHFRHNELSAAGVRNMPPFLQIANNLQEVNLNYNNLQSEGFNTSFRALHGSPVALLCCTSCGIESIEIGNGNESIFPGIWKSYMFSLQFTLFRIIIKRIPSTCCCTSLSLDRLE